MTNPVEDFAKSHLEVLSAEAGRGLSICTPTFVHICWPLATLQPAFCWQNTLP